MSGVQPIFRAGLFRPVSLWDDGWMWWCHRATGPRGHGPTIVDGAPIPIHLKHPHSMVSKCLVLSGWIMVNHDKSPARGFLVVFIMGKGLLGNQGQRYCMRNVTSRFCSQIFGEAFDRGLTELWAHPERRNQVTPRKSQLSNQKKPSNRLFWCSDLRHWEEPGVSHWNTEDSLSWISQICPNITIYYYNIYIYIVSS